LHNRYARRQQTEVNREKLLDKEISNAPLEPNENFAYLFLYARPVFAKEGLLNSIFDDETNFPKTLNELIQRVCNGEIYPRSYQPDFNPPANWKHRAEGVWGQMDYPTSDVSLIPRHTLNLQVDFDGSGHLFCGRAGDRYSPEDFSVFLEIIAGLTIRFVNFMGRLYERASYIGMIDIGLAMTGLKGSVVHTNNLRLHFTRIPYDRPDYRRSGRFSAIQMLEDPLSPAKYLTTPFVKAISQGWIDPFSQR
jgi:hypothetical protein